MCSWPTGRTRNRKRRPAALPQASFVCLKVLRPFAVFDVELSPAQGDVQSGGPGAGALEARRCPQQGAIRKTDRSTPRQGGVHQQEEDAVGQEGRESTPSGHQPRL